MADVADVKQDNPQAAYEQEDWPINKVGFVYIGIFVFLVIIPFVLWAAYPNSVTDVSRKLLVKPPSPELQVDPQQDLKSFRLHEDQRLNTYYWVDKAKGIVHIPIEQAMKKLAQSGIDGFPKGQP
jgi:hypothetical protein